MEESIIRYKSLSRYDEIAHFCTTRYGGVSVGNYASWNMSPFSGDDPTNVTRNYEHLTSIIDVSRSRIVLPYQTHGDKVLVIDENFERLTDAKQTEVLNGVDALVTNCRNLCVGITTADCVPLLFYDKQQKVIGAAHAGWRGTCRKIAGLTLETMKQTFGCDVADIEVVIGPSISVKAYNVGEEVSDAFRAEGFPVDRIFSKQNGLLYLDLWQANCWLLEQAGLSADRIEISGYCTFTEHERFFSARRLGIKSGRLLSGIMLK